MRGRRRSTPESRAQTREQRGQLVDVGPVMEAAAAFLAVRPRSVSETSRRLKQLGYPVALVDQVVAQLTELAYLDDAEFARGWIESRDRARPRGEMALRRELATKGVPRPLVDEALAARADAQSADMELAAAVRLLERRRSTLEREPDPLRRRQKAYALLARNGFDPETCREAAAAIANPANAI